MTRGFFAALGRFREGVYFNFLGGDEDLWAMDLPLFITHRTAIIDAGGLADI